MWECEKNVVCVEIVFPLSFQRQYLLMSQQLLFSRQRASLLDNQFDYAKINILQSECHAVEGAFQSLVVASAVTKRSHAEVCWVRFPVGVGSFPNENYLDFPRHTVLSYLSHYIQMRKWQALR